MSSQQIGQPRVASFGIWLKARLKERKWSQGELARRTAFDRSVVSNWARDVNRPQRRNIGEIARALELPEDEVLVAAGYEPEGDDGRPLFAEEAQRVVSELRMGVREAWDYLSQIEQAGVQVPVIGSASAGAVRWLSASDEFEMLPLSYIEGVGDPAIVRVSGDCLESLGIENGMSLLIDRAAIPRDGDIAVIRVGEEALVKQVTVAEDGLELHETDGDGATYFVDYNREDTEIVGVAIEVFRIERRRIRIRD